MALLLIQDKQPKWATQETRGHVQMVNIFGHINQIKIDFYTPKNHKYFKIIVQQLFSSIKQQLRENK